MKKLILIFVIILFLLTGLIGGPVKDTRDILVKLNFYKGFKGEKPKGESVVSSFFLKPLFVGKISFESNGKNEGAEIKKIFNLSGIDLMSEARWGWRKGEKKKEFQLLILNGHEFMVEITMKAKPDNFIVMVMNRQNSKELLKTDIILPERKSSVFGFEDSRGKPFFLSLSRAVGESLLRKEITAPRKFNSIRNPVLIRRVKPIYPKEALEKKLSGVVKIEAICDIYGRVRKTNVISGHPLLTRAALKSLKQWVYEPYLINSIPKPIRFTVIVKFKLDNNKPEKVSSVVKISNIPNIWPAKGYLTLTFGDDLRVDGNRKIVKLNSNITKNEGVNIAAKRGSKVIAPASGKVLEARFFKRYGKMVILDHGNDYISKYAHLDKLKVKKGEKIRKGTLIGLVGSTGIGSIPHLHWEVWYKGKPIDPLKLIKE